MNAVWCIWRLIVYRPWLYLANALAWTGVHIAPLATGLIVREYFDSLVGKGATGLSVWSLIAISVGFAAARVVLMLGGALADIRHRFNMKSLLTANVFERILERPGATALDETVGEAISRFRDDVMQVEHATSHLLDVIGMAGFAGISLYILLSINARVAALTFGPMIAVVLLSRAVASRIERYRRASREAAAAAVGAMGEAFTAVQAVKLAVAEDHVTAHIRRLNERRRRVQLQDRLVTEVLNSVYFNTVSIGTGLILLLAAGSMADGSFTVGDFSLFSFYIGYVSDFSTFLGWMAILLRQSKVSMQRLIEMMPGAGPAVLVSHSPIYLDSPPPEMGMPEAVEPFESLSVRYLTCLYEGSGNGVKGVDLDLRRGEFVVVTGRVGAGKTTLLRAILGLLPRQAGEIRWNGAAVDDPRTFFAPPRTAYTPQVPALFSDSLKGNIQFGWPDDSHVGRVLEMAAFEEDLEHMPERLETVVGARGLKLSGGQQHRVAAARMFVRRPQLLVVDDLSSAVDVNTEAAIWAHLFAEPDTSCLVVSHRRTALKRADRILVLRDGVVDDCGTWEELLGRSEEFRAIWSGRPSSAETAAPER